MTWSQTPSAASIESNFSNNFSCFVLLFTYTTPSYMSLDPYLYLLLVKIHPFTFSHHVLPTLLSQHNQFQMYHHLLGHVSHHVVDGFLHEEARPLHQGNQKLPAQSCPNTLSYIKLVVLDS